VAGTRERIVEAAAELIERQGASATSVDDILAASRTGKSQFYHYFGSKQGLISAVVERHRVLLIERQLSKLRRLDTWEGIEAWLDGLAEGGDQTCAALGALAAEVVGSDETIRRQVDQVFSEWASYLVRGLSAMQTRGLLRAGADPRALGQFAMAALHGGNLLSRTALEPAVLRRTLDHVLSYLRSFGRT
jgi:TetR/AcrR family transcriptional repressor of nem operon